MIPGLLLGIWRFWQIVTLLPALGMLAWFVDGYTKANQLTPTTILVLFIVVVIATVWAVATLFAYGATKHNANFCAVVDLLIMGGLIAGVYYLRGVTKTDCSSWSRGEPNDFSLNLGVFGGLNGSVTNPFSLNVNKTCAMLKASFAFGIINILLFFGSALILLMVHREHGNVVYSRTTTRRRSRSPRHSPRRSHHSSRSYSRRTYV